MELERGVKNVINNIGFPDSAALSFLKIGTVIIEFHDFNS